MPLTFFGINAKVEIIQKKLPLEILPVWTRLILMQLKIGMENKKNFGGEGFVLYLMSTTKKIKKNVINF